MRKPWGTSHDTGEFACESIERWWREKGGATYPGASSILLLCDGGGSNSASHYLFKLIFDSFGPIFDVSPLAMGRGSLRSASHSATPCRTHP